MASSRQNPLPSPPIHHRLTAADQLFHLLEGVVHTLDHLAEALAVGDTLVDDLLVDLAALRVAHADRVDHVVVGVELCDGAYSGRGWGPGKGITVLRQRATPVSQHVIAPSSTDHQSPSRRRTSCRHTK